jgi:putative peptidoglycan lipid II flippase
LAAYSIGALAASSTKLFASGFHAMLDTRTPVRYAVIALILGAGVGAILMWPLYAPGLAVGAAVGAWSYLLMLWSGLHSRIGRLFDGSDVGYMLKLVAACGVAAVAGLLTEAFLARQLGVTSTLASRAVLMVGTVGVFGVVYLAAGRILRVLPAGGLRVWTDGPSSE